LSVIAGHPGFGEIGLVRNSISAVTNGLDANDQLSRREAASATGFEPMLEPIPSAIGFLAPGSAHVTIFTKISMSRACFSHSLGGGQWMTFRRVVLPLIAPGVGLGVFLVFMASFDNVPVSLFFADERTEVLPIHLWQQIDTNLDVRTAAASGLIVIFTVVLMLIVERTGD